MKFWFTADYHFGHYNIIKYTNRPFQTVEEMDEIIINNHNSVVDKNDTVIHAGDFCLIKNKKIVYEKYINRLNGKLILLKGSHDYFIPWKNAITRWEGNITVKGKKYFVVVDHYALRVWPRSHYNSIMLFGHSHGSLPPEGKSHDIGVDANNFFPVSDEQIVEIMKSRPDNFNLVGR